MFKKIIFTVSFIIISFSGIAQKSINDYKYILIPKSFEFSKSEDQYQLNSLLKFLFNKYGYEAYFANDLPEDTKKNPCLALTADVINDDSNMFKTKLKIELKDCYSNVIITSKIGDSRLKEFEKGYNEAIRGAFETFQHMDYNYVAQESVTETPEKEKQPIKEAAKVEEKKEVILAETKTEEKTEQTKTELLKNTSTEIYYAQTITSGFQLVNSEPRVVMVLLNTSAKDVFIVKDKNAVVYKKKDKWIYSENNGITTSDKEVNIKF